MASLPFRRFCWLGLVVPTPALADSDPQIWLTNSATIGLSRKFAVSEEIIARFSDRRNGLYEIENSLLLGYRLTPKITLWAGYTHDPLYEGGRFTVMEHRLRTQVTFDNIAKIGPGMLSLRLRAEQRWREGINETAVRVRPFARYAVPLDRDRRTVLHITHESFIDLNRSSFQRVAGEERMRNLVAIRTAVSRRVGLEVGYLNQYGFVPGRQDSADHVASFAVNLSL